MISSDSPSEPTTPIALLHAAENELELVVDDVRRLVELESPSNDHDALARSAELIQGLMGERLDAHIARVDVGGVAHVRAEFGGAPRLLLLGHHDTVWALGTLDSFPFVIDDGRLRGPGVFDMKAGLVIAIHALRVAERAHPGSTADVVFLITGDEETGSKTSRDLIESTARECEYTLVLEAGEGEAVKVERKGGAVYEILIQGLASHAGLEPDLGVNAGVEAALQVLAIVSLNAPSLGTTVVPTLLNAGTTANTVPAHASLVVDSRASSIGEQMRIDEAIRALEPIADGATITVRGGITRPPLEPGSSKEVFDRAIAVAHGLGLAPLGGVAVGGCSDGNFTAAVGSKTLDGLGAVGGGAHATTEHVVIASIPRRIALLAGLIIDLSTEIR